MIKPRNPHTQRNLQGKIITDLKICGWFKYNLLQYGDVIVHIVIFTFLTSVKYTLILEHVFIVKKLYFSNDTSKSQATDRSVLFY
jgi:hypothetical protein